MMRIVILVVAIFCTLIVQAQEPFDKLMVRQNIDCEDVALNAPDLFKKYLEQNKLDSAHLFLSYWTRKCGDIEPLFRANIILALLERNYSDTLLTPTTIDHIYGYKTRMNFIRGLNYGVYDRYKAYFGFVQPGGEFDQFTQQLAQELKSTYPEESVERLLAGFYADEDESFFKKIQKEQYRGTVIQNRYNTTVNEYLNTKDVHLALLAGIWIPTNDAKVLGNHPDVGFQMGYKRKKWNYDLTITLKWGDTPEPYWATRKYSTGARELTREFFGGYIGFDVGRDIYRYKKHELQLLGGLGYDGFDVFKSTDPNSQVESAGSYNINFGAAYRYYVKPGFYMGFRAKYNVVDYTLSDVIDFTGNTVTIHFTLGGLANLFKKNALSRLEYDER